MGKTHTLAAETVAESVQKIGWIDIHTHLNFLEISPEEAIRAGSQVGIHHYITIGTEPDDWQTVIDLSEAHPEVFGTLGMHPHEGKIYDDKAHQFLRDNLNRPKIVAVGEIGLDYYYQNSSREEQVLAFRRQMDLAAEFNLPVEIHTRDADEDTVEILKEYKGKVKGVIHCFTGTELLAQVALDCGYNISFSGIVTFKKAEELQRICKLIPIDRMHVETDAPFLAPTPLRGVKNQPDFMLWTAQYVADLKQVPIEDFCQQMKLNAQKMFAKLQWQSPC